MSTWNQLESGTRESWLDYAQKPPRTPERTSSKYEHIHLKHDDFNVLYGNLVSSIHDNTWFSFCITTRQQSLSKSLSLSLKKPNCERSSLQWEILAWVMALIPALPKDAWGIQYTCMIFCSWSRLPKGRGGGLEAMKSCSVETDDSMIAWVMRPEPSMEIDPNSINYWQSKGPRDGWMVPTYYWAALFVNNSSLLGRHIYVRMKEEIYKLTHAPLGRKERKKERERGGFLGHRFWH